MSALGRDLDACGQCDGTGYLLDQTYGEAEIPAGAIPVQRCDTCERYEDDKDATRAAYNDTDASAWGYTAEQAAKHIAEARRIVKAMSPESPLKAALERGWT